MGYPLAKLANCNTKKLQHGYTIGEKRGGTDFSVPWKIIYV